MIEEPDILISKRATVIARDPCLCFEVEDFLPIESFRELSASFPSIDLCERSTTMGKRAFSPRDPQFAQFMAESEPWRRFAQKLSAPAFVEDCRRLAVRALLQARGLRGLKLWSPAPPANSLLRKLFTRTLLQLEFSYLTDGASIEAHTDGGSKLISLMLYFPESAEQQVLPLGTEFYRLRNGQDQSRWSNFSNARLSDDDDQAFRNASEIFYQSPFRPNVLVGFVKNDLSYHALQPISLPAGACRKSLNINLVAA